MTRRINAEAEALIKQWEGLRLEAYRPLEHDVLTIGYGHTSAAGEPIVTEGMRITIPQANAILASDLSKFEKCVSDAVKVELNDNQFGALVSLCYNIGETAFRKSTLLKKLNKGDYTGAQEQFHVWRKSGPKIVQGLVNRRAAEAALFGRGEFVSSNYVDAKPVKEPLVTKENILWLSGALGSLGGFVQGTGPIQWAFAALLLIAGIGIVRKYIFAG